MSRKPDAHQNIRVTKGPLVIDPQTGRIAESDCPVLPLNRSSPRYIERSLQRLEIFADRKRNTREETSLALREYGHAMLKEQRDALWRWVFSNGCAWR